MWKVSESGTAVRFFVYTNNQSKHDQQQKGPVVSEVYRDDLSDFIRYHKLDAYELTDDELAALLDVWRWSIWTTRNEPSAPDADVLDVVRDVQRRMAHEYNVEIDYNTILLLKQEAESLMHLRVLYAVPRALLYFLRVRGIAALVQSIRRIRRYQRMETPIDPHTKRRAYPRQVLRERVPDLMNRPYWRPLSSATLDERKRSDTWL